VIEIPARTLQDPEAALELEWLETNGLGGFAASTVIGLNTRRYHGLLVAATRPPVGRMLLLAKLEETLVADGERVELGANRYPGAIHPQGFRHLVGFRLDPFPIFTYEAAGVRIEKRVFMVHGENTTVIEYVRLGGGGGRARSVQLEVRPLIAFRDYHATTHENAALDRRVAAAPGMARLMPYPDLPALHLGHDAERLDPAGDWNRHFEYDRERERGLDFVEDLFQPLTLHFDLGRKPEATIVAAVDPGRTADRAAAYRTAELARRHAIAAEAAALAAGAGESAPLVEALAAASAHYLVARGAEQTIIAGYPWFADWGRDTMIALPGLTLTTGRQGIARQILLAFARVASQGMLPNRFPDGGEAPEYNTVDAALWYVEAVRALLDASPDRTRDLRFVHEHLYRVLIDIVDWHVRGTRYGIQVDTDGLLAAGEPGVQLTWMDAKVGDRVVTPRHGKPVEIQALWYNALRIMEGLAAELEPANPTRIAGYRRLAERARSSFRAQFWNEANGCLYDVVNGEARDPAIRPNQIFAVSLRHSMLEEDQARAVVAAVAKHLLTPVGLRSLAPSDPHYVGRYAGGPAERDAAYHQGTVWPWLLGPYISAYVRVHGRTDTARREAAALLAGIEATLDRGCLGQVGEVFDGDPPHREGGAVAQAWSVAEILRALVADVIAAPAAHRAESEASTRR
jgi:predicted glycogen debranching enzyme